MNREIADGTDSQGYEKKRVLPARQDHKGACQGCALAHTSSGPQVEKQSCRGKGDVVGHRCEGPQIICQLAPEQDSQTCDQSR